MALTEQLLAQNPEFPQEQVFEMPIDQMPEIGKIPENGQLFWTQRTLRPDEPGPNFHNIPGLEFGIDYQGDSAILKLPSSDQINHFIEENNPSGFSFEVSDKPMLYAEEFLEIISRRSFPLSRDPHQLGFALPDLWMDFAGYNYSSRPNSDSMIEHDRVAHLGLAAMPSGEVDKIAAMAKTGLEASDSQAIARFTGRLDRLLDTLSLYAITPSEAEGEELRFKLSHWKTIMFKQHECLDVLGKAYGLEYPTLDMNMDDDSLQDEMNRIDKIIASQLGLELLDKEAIDESIAILQGVK